MVDDNNPGQVSGTQGPLRGRQARSRRGNVVATFKRVAVAVALAPGDSISTETLERPKAGGPRLGPRRQLAGDRPQRRSQHLRPRRPDARRVIPGVDLDPGYRFADRIHSSRPGDRLDRPEGARRALLAAAQGRRADDGAAWSSTDQRTPSAGQGERIAAGRGAADRRRRAAAAQRRACRLAPPQLRGAQLEQRPQLVGAAERIGDHVAVCERDRREQRALDLDAEHRRLERLGRESRSARLATAARSVSVRSIRRIVIVGVDRGWSRVSSAFTSLFCGLSLKRLGLRLRDEHMVLAGCY